MHKMGQQRSDWMGGPGIMSSSRIWHKTENGSENDEKDV